MIVALRRTLALAMFIVAVFRPMGILENVFLWIGAMMASLTYFIAECFSPSLTFTRRLGTAYLLVTGIIYSGAGALGFVQDYLGMIEPFVWSLLVSPFVWITLVKSHGWECDVVPHEPHRFISAIAVCLGLIAVGAALAMSRSMKIGYQIWMTLLCLIIVLIGGYAAAAIRSSVDPRVGIACGWLITYMVAFWFAYRDSEPHSAKSSEIA